MPVQPEGVGRTHYLWLAFTCTKRWIFLVAFVLVYNRARFNPFDLFNILVTDLLISNYCLCLSNPHVYNTQLYMHTCNIYKMYCVYRHMYVTTEGWVAIFRVWNWTFIELKRFISDRMNHNWCYIACFIPNKFHIETIHFILWNKPCQSPNITCCH